MTENRDDDRPLRTAHEWVRDRLRRAIVAGVYPPGAKLVQTEIAARFGTSVTPVREAMRDLVNDGLIDFDPHRAARVREIDVADALEVNRLRLVLEPMAAHSAALNATPEEVQTIRLLADEAAATAEDEAWLEANRRFHLAIIAAAHSPRLEAILSNLRQISSFYLVAMVRTCGSVRQKSTGEHVALVDAIAAHDPDTASAVMSRHLAESSQLGEGLEAARSASMQPETPAG